MLENVGSNTFTKAERLCGKMAISNLMDKGRWGVASHLKYCYLPSGAEKTRILVSVPKRYFKRAVRRNLIKRRIREVYRKNKSLLGDGIYDIMFIYSSPCVMPYTNVEEDIVYILTKIAAR